MTDARQAAAERIGGALGDAGMVRLPARIFAALMVADSGRMTSAELAEFLEVSPAGISGAIRYLTPLGFVRRERERGSRRDVYVVDDDAWHEGMTQHDQIYAPIRAALTAAAGGLDDGRARQRILLAVEFLEFMSAELDGIAERWEEHKRRLADT
ncbi:GbsR/MarR family transcriptional regulator [Nocardioides sp. GXZ039]|uniref:GbsR/MarR family transcriptional regulator n=1 Tax=Nocardioides sp. GXZ039 TaxID=3136018 RepID=UPI0030F37E7E